jgi:hypothetical protein
MGGGWLPIEEVKQRRMSRWALHSMPCVVISASTHGAFFNLADI